MRVWIRGLWRRRSWCNAHLSDLHPRVNRRAFRNRNDGWHSNLECCVLCAAVWCSYSLTWSLASFLKKLKLKSFSSLLWSSFSQPTVPRGWILMTLVIPLTFPLAPPCGGHLCFSVKCLINRWMDCLEIWHTLLCPPPQDELWELWWPRNFSSIYVHCLYNYIKLIDTSFEKE